MTSNKHHLWTTLQLSVQILPLTYHSPHKVLLHITMKNNRFAYNYRKKSHRFRRLCYDDIFFNALSHRDRYSFIFISVDSHIHTRLTRREIKNIKGRKKKKKNIERQKKLNAEKMLSAFELSFLPAVSFVITVESTTCKKLKVEVRIKKKKYSTSQVIKVFIFHISMELLVCCYSWKKNNLKLIIYTRDFFYIFFLKRAC